MSERRGMFAAFSLLCAVFAVALAGCAQGTAGPGGPSPSTSGTSAAGLTPSGQPSPEPSPSGQPPTSTTLRGTMTEGVEAGCRILKADTGKNYELLGLDAALSTPGTRLEVDGHVAVGMASHCMQGTIFQVTMARRL